jgi:hypothetical protein
MYGNVAEWVADIYRPMIDEEFSDFNYYRGNVVVQSVKNADGSYKKVGNTEIKYDTLADGRLVYKGLPGEFERKTLKITEITEMVISVFVRCWWNTSK